MLRPQNQPVVAELSAYGWHGKNVDQGGSYWVVVDVFAFCRHCPISCLCCNWVLQLPSIRFTYKFKRKDRDQTLGNISAVKIASDRTIDPALLFQRFLAVSRSEDPLKTNPNLLRQFETMLRSADFSSEAVLNYIPTTDCYVLDGGSLLHRLPWKKGNS